MSISSYISGDRQIVSSQDSGACAPAVTAGHTYAVTAWYKSTVQPYIVVYYRNGAGTWVHWSQSAELAAASSWTQATWATPPVPGDAPNISVGMGISGVGSITMDDFGWLASTSEPTPIAFVGNFLLLLLPPSSSSLAISSLVRLHLRSGWARAEKRSTAPSPRTSCP